MEDADLIIGEGNPVVAVQVNHEKNYAFVEVTKSRLQKGDNRLTSSVPLVRRSDSRYRP
jgi:hypothetical protein